MMGLRILEFRGESPERLRQEGVPYRVSGPHFTGSIDVSMDVWKADWAVERA